MSDHITHEPLLHTLRMSFPCCGYHLICTCMHTHTFVYPHAPNRARTHAYTHAHKYTPREKMATVAAAATMTQALPLQMPSTSLLRHLVGQKVCLMDITSLLSFTELHLLRYQGCWVWVSVKSVGSQTFTHIYKP